MLEYMVAWRLGLRATEISCINTCKVSSTTKLISLLIYILQFMGKSLYRLLSPNSGNTNNAAGANSDGNLNNNNVNNTNAARPTVYLSVDVEIASGTGTELDPYVLQLGA